MNDDNRSKKMGRPSAYTFALAQEICDTIASSSKGLKKLCQENIHWPTHDTIYRWLKENLEFSDLYARSKQNQIEVLVDEILEISDEVTHDRTINHKGQLVTDHEHINRTKLRIDTRKWLASKLVPRVYGNSEPKLCSECMSKKEDIHLTDEELLKAAKEILQSIES